jgi:hypothetical protein
MRISHHAILSGLPRTTVGVLDSGAEKDRKSENKPHHISSDELWDAVKAGRALDESHVQHTKSCRDCREFVLDFSREARGTGLSFQDLLPPDEKKLHKPE